MSDQVTIILPDVTKPEITAFAIPDSSSSLNITISSFTASDNKAVAGYKLSETAITPSIGDSGWTSSSPLLYTFDSPGTKTLYAWVKDEAGNISSAGSSQVIIALDPLFSEETISICDGYTYEGWATEGVYQRTLVAASGADSIVTTNLYVNPTYNVTEEIIIKYGEDYFGWSQSGEYQRTLTSVFGCDSIVITYLSVAKQMSVAKRDTTYEDIGICEGSSYYNWSESGVYERLLKSKNNTDSIVITNLTVNPTFYKVEELTIYEGDDYMGWTEAGEYQRNLTSVYGCDSIITTILHVDSNQSVTDNITQFINLKKGWNIFSSSVVPQEPGMDKVLEQLIQQGDLLMAQDENGNTFESIKSSAGWANNIGDLELTEGYEIQVNSNCMLAITGRPIELPVDIYLKKGWNIISFPYDGTIDAMQIFQPLIDKGILDKVLNEKGFSIEFWRNRGWVNKIGNLESGEGYKVLVNSDATIHIKNSNEKTSVITPKYAKTQHYEPDYIENGFCHMNINILGISESDLNAGDEIAVFDGATCVGAY